jgi:hypothetical protein
MKAKLNLLTLVEHFKDAADESADGREGNGTETIEPGFL